MLEYGSVKISAEEIKELAKEKLLELTKIYAKNWLAHGGCWFLAAEEKFGIETAIEMDSENWRKFTVIEVNRLIEFLETSYFS